MHTLAGLGDDVASALAHLADLVAADVEPVVAAASHPDRPTGAVTAETLSDNETLASSKTFDPGLHIGSQSYFDLAAQYTFKENYTLRLGINNIFDKQPPYVTSGNANVSGTNLCPTGPCNGNTYPGTYDALGRNLYASITLDF